MTNEAGCDRKQRIEECVEMRAKRENLRVSFRSPKVIDARRLVF